MSESPRITVEKFRRMIEAGMFDKPISGCPIELFRGEIVEKSAATIWEEDLTSFVHEWAALSIPRERMRLRAGNSLAFEALDSVVRPDMSMMAQGNYSKRWPVADETFLGCRSCRGITLCGPRHSPSPFL